jgi:hypothetical protein
MNEESDTQSVRRRTRKRKRSPCRRDSLRSDSPLQPDRKRTRLLSSESESSSSVSGCRLHRPVAGDQQILNNNGSSHESGSEGHDILCTADEREGISGPQSMENSCGEVRGISDCDSSQEAERLGEATNSPCQPAAADSTSGENGEISEETDTQSVQRTTRKRKRSACRRDSLRSDSPLQPDRKRTRFLCSDCENSSSDTSKE